MRRATCQCGCGEYVARPGNRFVVGHNPKKPRTRPTLLCPVCGASFLRKTKTQRCCTRSCGAKARTNKDNFPKRGKDHHNYNGGFFYSQGRLMVVCRDGSMTAWYRIVMEGKLGRPLATDEVVHHLNGDFTDDRPENLRVLKQSDHISLHRDELVAARWPQTEAMATQ